MKKIIITIDGYSSCGKSTLARQLARELDYIYIDSGAMYRAITFYFIQNRVDWSDTAAVKAALENIHLEFEYNPETSQSDIYLKRRKYRTSHPRDARSRESERGSRHP